MRNGEDQAADAADGKSRRFAYVVVMLAFAVYSAGLAYYATTRPIDADEGFYATAARLVWQGEAPYRDFFYQQAPLLPYLYSWMWAVHPRSLVAMRLISATCGSLAVLLWGICLISVRRLPANIALATFATVLLNPYWISWNVVVKTFAVANLLMTVAIICLYSGLHSTRWRWFFVAGLALGGCTSVRSFYGPVLVVVFLWLSYQGARESKIADPGMFLAGSVCGLLPMLVSFVRDPRAFLFNNIQYHRLDAGYMWWNGKITEGYQSVQHTTRVYFDAVVVRLLGSHPYFTISVVIAIVGGLSLWKLRKAREGPYSEADHRYYQLALLMLVTYMVVALIPFPPYEQYFDGPLVPFLVPFIAEGLRVTWKAGKKRSIALALVGAIYCAVEIGAETATRSGDPICRVSSYSEAARLIEANSQPDEVVLSFWPGYVFESGRQYFPGLDDNFVFRIMNKTGPTEKLRYHVVSPERITSAISHREVNLLVLGDWLGEYEKNLSRGQLQAFHDAIQSNYLPLAGGEKFAIYRRCAGGVGGRAESTVEGAASIQ
jgi:hypothetical protein